MTNFAILLSLGLFFVVQGCSPPDQQVHNETLNTYVNNDVGVQNTERNALVNVAF